MRLMYFRIPNIQTKPAKNIYNVQQFTIDKQEATKIKVKRNDETNLLKLSAPSVLHMIFQISIHFILQTKIR